MAERSGFFDAHASVNSDGKVTYDRTYLAESFAKYFSSFIGNGIFGGKLSELMVIQPASSGMRITVLPGMGWINGFWYENTSDLTIDVATSDGLVNRIDNVVIRWGKVERKIWIDIVKGLPATNAVAPTIERSSDYYDLKIAEIHVNAGLTKITQENIIDTRLDNNVCGLVKGIIEQIDTAEYIEQLNSFVSNYAIEFKAFLENLELEGIKELENLFDRLNALIEDESAFATLALKVDDIASEAALVNQTLGYSKKNLIPYPYDEKTHTENGITYTDNGDGTITANGTSTEQSYFVLCVREMLKPGEYVITSGLERIDSYYVYGVKLDKITGQAAGELYRWGEKFTITAEDAINNNLFVAIFIAKGVTAVNLTFKPMLRRAEILDNTWEPYRLSVAETIQEDEVDKGCFYRINRFTKAKEWLNAPTKPGIEYCLAERWNNKPIYQKTLYAATLPNNSVVGIEVDSAYTAIVSINGYAIDTDNNYYHPFPIIVSGVTPIAVIAGFEGDGGNGGTVVIRTNADVTNYQAYITVKYTKT